MNTVGMTLNAASEEIRCIHLSKMGVALKMMTAWSALTGTLQFSHCNEMWQLLSGTMVV